MRYTVRPYEVVVHFEVEFTALFGYLRDALEMLKSPNSSPAFWVPWAEVIFDE